VISNFRLQAKTSFAFFILETKLGISPSLGNEYSYLKSQMRETFSTISKTLVSFPDARLIIPIELLSIISLVFPIASNKP
jgi:hypothetical protein